MVSRFREGEIVTEHVDAGLPGGRYTECV